jgi:hypothetical protein
VVLVGEVLEHLEQAILMLPLEPQTRVVEGVVLGIMLITEEMAALVVLVS